MVREYRTDEDFMRAIEGVPVTIDQWQLEKLALATRRARVSYCLPGVPSDFLGTLWGPAFRDPSDALSSLFRDLPPKSRIAVVPEGPYVLAGIA